MYEVGEGGLGCVEPMLFNVARKLTTTHPVTSFMPDGSPNTQAPPVLSLTEALQTAAQVETILQSEQQWVMSRLSWLFTSQSFCILAFCTLSTCNSANGMADYVAVLKLALPIFGILSCLAVGLAVHAANRVGHDVGESRAWLTMYVNKLLPKVRSRDELEPKNLFSVVGAKHRSDHLKWTLWAGALPHYLPWVLLTLWTALLGVYFKNLVH